MKSNYKTILNKNGLKIAYNKISQKNNTQKPGIVFLSGFNSDMDGNKAIFLQKKSIELGYQYIRFDYSGHGSSEGVFEQCNISIWLEDVITILKKLSSGPQILVGSSMGGWLALLTAIKIPQFISAIVCIAAAPDFTKRIFEKELSIKQKIQLEKNGKINIYSEYSKEGYSITKNLIDDGKKHLLLGKNITIKKPVRLIHGINDMSVPWKDSLKLLNKLVTKDVELTFIKNGDHRLSSINNLELIWNIINSIKLEPKKY